MGAARNWTKTVDYSPRFSARYGKKMMLVKTISLERASKGEQNGTNFSSVALSSEELRVQKET